MTEEDKIAVIETVATTIKEWAEGMGGETRRSYETIAEHVQRHRVHIAAKVPGQSG